MKKNAVREQATAFKKQSAPRIITMIIEIIEAARQAIQIRPRPFFAPIFYCIQLAPPQ